jgi:DNA polymerase-3 subunit beta
MNPMDYPEMPNPGADEAVELEASVLKSMIDTTLFAVSIDDKKPAHTGELFVLEHDKLTLVALDGYRLAIVERPVTSNREIRIIIPAKTMGEVSRLMGDLEEKVLICANRRFVVFRGGDYVIISRLIDGDFLDYTRVVPVSCTTTVTVPTRPFINCVERASLIITERLKNPLRVRFDNGVTVRCQTSLGSVMDEIDAGVEGQAVEVGFNNRYLLDALRFCGKDEVVFQISGPLAPVKIVPTEGSDFLFLVLPVRFKNE